MAIYFPEQTSEVLTPDSGEILLYNKNNSLYSKDSSGTEQIADFVEVSGDSNTTYIIQDKTSDYTILSSETTPFHLFTNYGATQDIIFTLPSSSIGYKISFQNLSSAHFITIKTNNQSTEKINSFNEIYVKTGEFLELVCISENQWIGFRYNQNAFNLILGIGEGKVAAGIYYSLAIDNTGKAWAWGQNSYGKLGDNSLAGKCTPVAVCGNITFCQIATGDSHSLAINNTGKAWAWGYNNYGQLGINSTTSKRTPVAVYGNITFCQIFSGLYYHSLGMDNTGKAWAWGYNNYGQLGINSVVSKRTPVAVYGNITFCQISIGEGNSFGLDYSGKAWAWGYNNYGQLGDNSTLNKSTPVAVCGDIIFCQIVSYSSHSFGIDNTGKAWAWGYNIDGRLGDNSTVAKSTPVAVCGDITFCKLSTGSTHSLGIDNIGKAWAWGNNNYGQLGDNSTTNKSTPVAVYGNITFCQISAGTSHSLGVDNTGKAWAWGSNAYGQLGDNTTTSKSTPVLIQKYFI